MPKKILIAGLPNSGKSTYIAALWSCIEDRFAHMKMGLAELPDDCEYLNQLSSKWNELKKCDRSYADNLTVSIPLTVTGTDDVHQLFIPDFKGETFVNLIAGQPQDSFIDTIKSTDGLLYFIGNFDSGRFEDDIENVEAIQDDNEPVNVQFNLTDIPADTLNMLILKYLTEHFVFKKIIVCITACDDKGKGFSAKEYISETSPGLFNYLDSLSPKVDYMGISAQGCNYESLGDADKDLFMTKTQDGKRAYVIIGNDTIYDITLPIYSALNL